MFVIGLSFFDQNPYGYIRDFDRIDDDKFMIFWVELNQSKIFPAIWKGKETTSIATAKGSRTNFSSGFILGLDLYCSSTCV